MTEIRKARIIGFVLLLIISVLYFFRIGGEQFLSVFGNVFPVVCSGFAVLGLLLPMLALRHGESIKLPWMAIFLGALLFCLAECAYGLIDIVTSGGAEELFPTSADFFWMAGYFLFFAGLVWMIVSYVRGGLPAGNTAGYGIIALIGIVISAVMYRFLISPILLDSSLAEDQRLVLLFYPIADIMLIVPSFVLMYITGLFGAGAASKPWRYLALGFMCITIADVAYAYLGLTSGYGVGNFIDVAWNTGYICLAWAGFFQQDIMLKKINR